MYSKYNVCIIFALCKFGVNPFFRAVMKTILVRRVENTDPQSMDCEKLF